MRHLTKQRCCKETRTSFLMVGGDNVAESLAAVPKSQLRRLGLQKVVNDPIEHRNVLAVHYLNKKTWFGKCPESTRTLSAAGNEKLSHAYVSVQRSTLEQLKRKKQLTHSAGNF